MLSFLGLILSHSSLKFQLDGNPLDNPFNVEQVIRYNECIYSPKNISTYRLKVARNFISYEAREKIIRYAMTSKVTPLGGKIHHKSQEVSMMTHCLTVISPDEFKMLQSCTISS
jgi:hypothetical protein